MTARRTPRAFVAASLLLALAAGCGGGGSAVAPAAKTAAVTASATSSPSSAPKVLATNTTPVTLSLKLVVPKRTTAHSVHTLSVKGAAARRPAYIQNNVTNIQAIVQPLPSSTYQSIGPNVGSCNFSPNPNNANSQLATCTVQAPVPLSVATSNIIIQLIDGNGVVLGQNSSITITANTLTPGAANTYNDPNTLYFQPIVQTIQVVLDNPSSYTFYGDTAAPQFGSIEVQLLDADGNDVSGDTDGVLDSNGNPIDTVVITATNGMTFSANPGDNPATATITNNDTVATINVDTPNPATDFVFNNASYDGTNVSYPDFGPTVFQGTNQGYIAYPESLANSEGYSFVPYVAPTHGITLYGNAQGGGFYGYGGQNSNDVYIEYPAYALVNGQTDEIDVTEGDASDAADGVFISIDEQIGSEGLQSNPFSNCAAITSYYGSTLTYNGPNTPFYFPYLTAGYGSSFNGTCTMGLTDDFGNLAEIDIYVNNPTIVIQARQRHATLLKHKVVK